MASANSGSITNKLAAAYFGSGSFKFLLVSSVPSEADLDTFVNRSSVANEVTGTGYTSGGSAVTCTVGAYDATNNRTPVTWSSPAAWAASTITAVGGWIYKAVGSAATDELIGFVDFGGSIASTGGAFTVTISAPTYINR